MYLLNELSARELIIFIGLCFASFAFLSSYASFPKNLLVNIKEIVGPDKEKSKIKIITYFYVMDFITAWVLVFIVLSIFIITGLLVVKLKLAWHNDPLYTCLRWYISMLSFAYLVIMGVVIYSTNNMRKKYWAESSRKKWIIFFSVLIVIQFSILIFISNPCFNIKLDWIFIFIIFMLTILFCLLIFLLAHYNPLTELAKCNDIVTMSEEKKENKDQK